MIEKLLVQNAHENEQSIGKLTKKLEDTEHLLHVQQIRNSALSDQLTATFDILKNVTNSHSVIQVENKKFQAKINFLEEALKKLSLNLESSKNDGANEFAKNLLEKNPNFLSQNQLTLLSGFKKKINWTSEDLAKGFALRMKGQGVYKLMTKSIGYPLPSETTLYRHAKKLKLTPG